HGHLSVLAENIKLGAALSGSAKPLALPKQRGVGAERAVLSPRHRSSHFEEPIGMRPLADARLARAFLKVPVTDEVRDACQNIVDVAHCGGPPMRPEIFDRLLRQVLRTGNPADCRALWPSSRISCGEAPPEAWERTES